MRVIGLDIGGAQLKASDGESRSMTRPFAVWRTPERLGDELAALLKCFPRCERLAVTMTAELADCYATKSEGVDRVLQAVERVAGDVPVGVWQTPGEFVPPEVAREFPLLVAAANWHALATWAGRMLPQGCALLVDIGSTTSDLIPLEDGWPVAAGRTDVQRLVSGELVYTGVRRTPLCAVGQTVRFRGEPCPLAAELFATTLDAYITLGDIAENPDDVQTANGRPATREAAHDRLARMLACDREEFTVDDAYSIARQLIDAQFQTLSLALQRVLERLPGPCESALTAGEGEFLAQRLVSSVAGLGPPGALSLNTALGREHSRAACAYALARLGRERL